MFSLVLRATLLALPLFCLFTSTAAEEPIKLAIGGPAIAAELEAKRAEIEKSLGQKLDMKVIAYDISIGALHKGLVDAAIMGPPIEEAVQEAMKKSPENKVTAGEFESFVFQKIPAFVLLHSDNPVSSLTKEQLSGILSGKIKNWSEVGGKSLPITALSAKNYIAITQAVQKEYVGGKSPVLELVVDKDGLLKRMKADPGVIAFSPKLTTTAEMKIKMFESAAASTIYFVTKRPASAGGKKLADYMKSLAPK